VVKFQNSDRPEALYATASSIVTKSVASVSGILLTGTEASAVSTIMMMSAISSLYLRLGS